MRPDIVATTPIKISSHARSNGALPREAVARALNGAGRRGRLDLDAARGTGDNRSLVKQIVGQLNCQVGGGIRDIETAQELLNMGGARSSSAPRC